MCVDFIKTDCFTAILIPNSNNMLTVLLVFLRDNKEIHIVSKNYFKINSLQIILKFRQLFMIQ